MKLPETSHCPNCQQLTERVVKLEEKLLEALKRIWTVIATCAQQGRAVFLFLLDSVQAHLCGTPPPSLLPSGS